jgi:hypothetical protein
MAAAPKERIEERKGNGLQIAAVRMVGGKLNGDQNRISNNIVVALRE